MKNLILFCILFIFLTTAGNSQSCLPNGITFTTQESIDNFQTNYSGCTEIEGNVEINGPQIVNLNGLSVLTSIGGYLDINYNDSLIDLSGLDNLNSIGEWLSIGHNESLISISSFENLNSIGEWLSITYNDVLTSLNGL